MYARNLINGSLWSKQLVNSVLYHNDVSNWDMALGRAHKRLREMQDHLIQRKSRDTAAKVTKPSAYRQG